MPYPRGYKPRKPVRDTRHADAANRYWDEVLKDSQPALSWGELVEQLRAQQAPPVTEWCGQCGQNVPTHSTGRGRYCMRGHLLYQTSVRS